MLELGFSECNMGIIPHAVDEILIGSIDRWRSHRIDVLFILGANDGVLPAISKDEGMLTDKDRGLLKELGLELAPDTGPKLLMSSSYYIAPLQKQEEYCLYPIHWQIPRARA